MFNYSGAYGSPRRRPFSPFGEDMPDITTGPDFGGGQSFLPPEQPERPSLVSDTWARMRNPKMYGGGGIGRSFLGALSERGGTMGALGRIGGFLL